MVSLTVLAILISLGAPARRVAAEPASPRRDRRHLNGMQVARGEAIKRNLREDECSILRLPWLDGLRGHSESVRFDHFLPTPTP